MVTAGIVIDAFLIRMTLIPALVSLIGDQAWWLPRRLDRAMPNVDIEGAVGTRAAGSGADRMSERAPARISRA